MLRKTFSIFCAEPYLIQMIHQTISKTCVACGKAVKGRSDKKFCDDYCRNVYNNDLKSDSNNYVRKYL